MESMAEDLCSTPPASLLGVVAATTPDAVSRKRPAAHSPNVSTELLPNYMEEPQTEYIAPAVVGENDRERQTLEDLRSTPPTTWSPRTLVVPGRKRPAVYSSKALARLLLNSSEDFFLSFMEKLLTKYVAPDTMEAKRERHMRVLRSLRMVLILT